MLLKFKQVIVDSFYAYAYAYVLAYVVGEKGIPLLYFIRKRKTDYDGTK